MIFPRSLSKMGDLPENHSSIIWSHHPDFEALVLTRWLCSCGRCQSRKASFLSQAQAWLPSHDNRPLHVIGNVCRWHFSTGFLRQLSIVLDSQVWMTRNDYQLFPSFPSKKWLFLHPLNLGWPCDLFEPMELGLNDDVQLSNLIIRELCHLEMLLPSVETQGILLEDGKLQGGRVPADSQPQQHTGEWGHLLHNYPPVNGGQINDLIQVKKEKFQWTAKIWISKLGCLQFSLSTKWKKNLIKLSSARLLNICDW